MVGYYTISYYFFRVEITNMNYVWYYDGNIQYFARGLPSSCSLSLYIFHWSTPFTYMYWDNTIQHDGWFSSLISAWDDVVIILLLLYNIILLLSAVFHRFPLGFHHYTTLLRFTVPAYVPWIASIDSYHRTPPLPTHRVAVPSIATMTPSALPPSFISKSYVDCMASHLEQ